MAVRIGTVAMRASSSGPFTDASKASRSAGEAEPAAQCGDDTDECNCRSVRAHRPLGQMGRLAQAEALRLEVLLQLLRDLGLHLFRLDLTVTRLGVFVVARQLVVFAFDLRDLHQSRVVRSLLRTKIVPKDRKLVEFTLDTIDLRGERDVRRVVGSLHRVRRRLLVGRSGATAACHLRTAARRWIV